MAEDWDHIKQKIVSEGGYLTAYTVGNGDVFIKTPQGDEIRVSMTSGVGGITVTAAGQTMTPWAVNGLQAFQVWRRKKSD